MTRRRVAVAVLAVLGVLVLLAGAVAAFVAVRVSHQHPVSASPVLAVPAELTLPGAPPQLGWPTGAHAAIDVQGFGRLPGHAAGVAVPVGSVAKVMTAHLVLQAHPLAAGETGPLVPVTEADAADYRSRVGSGQSLVPLQAGERLTERQALDALLVPSANDVATLLARWVSGSVDAFVAQMNARAQQLAMTTTRYTDPSGFDASTVSSADDQVVLAEAALADPTFAAVVAQREATVPLAGRVRNYNTLLATPGVVGVKTGSTLAAGGNLVFAAHADVSGRPVTFVGAVLGVSVGRAPLAALDDAIAAAAAALRAAGAAVRPVTALPAGTVVATAGSPWGASARLATTGAVTVVGLPGQTLRLALEASPLTPGAAGRLAGRLTLTSPGAGSAPVATDVVTTGPLAAPSREWQVREALGVH